VRVTTTSLDELDQDTCYRRLAGALFGRVVATSGALPLVVPVNYGLDGHAVVFRTASGSRLQAATRNAVVAFEVDDIDPVRRCGWSVVVTGTATPVTAVSDIVRLEQLGLAPWGPGVKDQWVRIVPGLITGRHLISTLAQGA
jgi:uncharacterized protein